MEFYFKDRKVFDKWGKKLNRKKKYNKYKNGYIIIKLVIVIPVPTKDEIRER